MIYGPDSPAQIYIQAAEHVRESGALVPFQVSSPLLPLLIAALVAMTGVSEEGAFAGLVAVAYVAGCAGLFLLVRRFRPERLPAVWAALLYAVAPSRLFTVSMLPDGSRLLFWSLTPFLALTLDSFRQRPRRWNVSALLAVVGLLAASLPLEFGLLDLLAALEIAGVLVVSLPASCMFMRGRWALFIVFLVLSGWKLEIEPLIRRQPPPMPEGVLAWIERQSHNGRVFGPVSVQFLANSTLAQVGELIAGSDHHEESLLWLRAMAIEYLVSDDWRKFHSSLECVYEEQGWCVYHFPDPGSAPVVLVSRHRWPTLRPIRGLLDIEGLEAYLEWAGRPEAAGIDWKNARSAEIRADLGPDDLLLIRLHASPGWRAFLEEAEGVWKALSIDCDPLGFMVLDPEGAGPVVMRIEYTPSWTERLFPAAREAKPLPGGDFPIIQPDGVVDAFQYTLPPFSPGALLSIFGRNFAPGRTRVLFDGQSAEVLWVGPQQINVRLPSGLDPGSVAVVVESNERRSYPSTIEVRRSKG